MNFQTFLVNGELKLPNAQSTRVRFCLKTVISFPVWPTVYTDPVKTAGPIFSGKNSLQSRDGVLIWMNENRSFQNRLCHSAGYK